MIAMLFTPNCGRWLAFTLGVILTSAPKLLPSKAGQSSYGWVCFTRFPV